jgi:hypothetical protein
MAYTNTADERYGASEIIVDTEAPSISSLSFTDTIVTLGDVGFDLINLPITMGVADNLSGVEKFTLYCVSPSSALCIYHTTSNCGGME